jgi:translation initiation factor 3 subunit B
MAQEPRLDESNDRIICLDNIPKVGTDKKDKLKKILQNLITTYGKIANEFYPEGEDGVLKGYMFVEYENGASAMEAVAQLNGYRLDKAHSFKCNFVSDFDKYRQMSLSENNVEEALPYKNPGQLHWYLTNPDAYDQFCLLHNDMFTTVMLNTRNQPTVLKTREVT